MITIVQENEAVQLMSQYSSGVSKGSIVVNIIRQSRYL